MSIAENMATRQGIFGFFGSDPILDGFFLEKPYLSNSLTMKGAIFLRWENGNSSSSPLG
jgi:hypothetical protein